MELPTSSRREIGKYRSLNEAIGAGGAAGHAKKHGGGVTRKVGFGKARDDGIPCTSFGEGHGLK
ncbi:hypothetical protein HPP92_018846 [Vanilla planifolia]|uniref:Uncharacterized protein n=1 Tax=Vanilla planifolia TaxID=51239 RepID=A0A835QBD2_VANPL|nr:hypothetical protein HPP92_018846 [Vanilla planifolia]